MKYLELAKQLDETEELSADIKYSIYGTYADLYIDTGKTEEAKNLLPLLEELVKTFPVAKQHFATLQKKLH